MGQEEEDVEERRKEGRKQQLKKQKEAKTPGPRSWASRASGQWGGLRAPQGSAASRENLRTNKTA